MGENDAYVSRPEFLAVTGSLQRQMDQSNRIVEEKMRDFAAELRKHTETVNQAMHNKNTSSELALSNLADSIRPLIQQATTGLANPKRERTPAWIVWGIIAATVVLLAVMRKQGLV